MEGSLYVISGFSGSGKTSLCKEVLKRVKGIELIKSYTTRYLRIEETEENYTFVTLEAFQQMISNDEFLETVTYNRYFYGTPKRQVEKLLGEGKNVLLEIDVQGYKKILSSGLLDRTRLHSIFIAASATDVFKRLKARNTEDINKILSRLSISIMEAKEIELYDSIIVNTDFNKALIELEKFLSGDDIQINNKAFERDRFVQEMELIIQQQVI